MERLKLDTRKSLYPPVKVEIIGEDGEPKVYTSHKLTREFNEQLIPLELKIQTGKSEGIYEWVALMFDVESEVLNKLERWEVEDIYIYASKMIEETSLNRGIREMKFLEDKLKKMKKAAGLSVDKSLPKQPKRKIPSSKNVRRSGDKD